MSAARRHPVVATIIVVLAVATMIGLGVWQLQRASWKEGLLARYEANRTLPPIAYPAVATNTDPLLFRRATGSCDPTSVRATAGRNMDDASGWSHVAQCRAVSSQAPGMSVDIGWSSAFDAPVRWSGGPVEGLIVPAGKDGIRLVAARPAPGLEPSQPPGPETISNNHRFYAAQWFFFAGVAALIYWLALRRRARPEPAKTP